jgi:non-ribosomal peptide synthetase component F
MRFEYFVGIIDGPLLGTKMTAAFQLPEHGPANACCSKLSLRKVEERVPVSPHDPNRHADMSEFLFKWAIRGCKVNDTAMTTSLNYSRTRIGYRMVLLARPAADADCAHYFPFFLEGNRTHWRKILYPQLHFWEVNPTMNIGNFLTAAGEQHPGRPAFIWGDQVTTYSQANARADSLAVALKHLGLMGGERVGVFMWNCPQLLESFFATWKVGGCVVPLNPRFLANEVVYHLGDSRTTAVIFSEEFRDMMFQIRDLVPTVKHFICIGQSLPGQIAFEELIAGGERSGGLSVELGDDDVAWLFYTSGTTGRPKGAMLTHTNLALMALVV